MSEEFNPISALEFLKLCLDFRATKADYFRFECAKYHIKEGQTYYFLEFDDEKFQEYIKEYMEEYSTSSEETRNRKNDILDRAAVVKKKCGQIGIYTSSWPYVNAHPVCPFYSNLQLDDMLEKHYAIAGKIVNSDFYCWLNSQPQFIVALSKFKSKQLKMLTPYWEKLLVYPLDLDFPVLKLTQSVCSSLLLVKYPHHFGRLISSSWLLGGNDETQVPQKIVKAAHQILDYASENSLTFRTLTRSLQQIAEGRLPERYEREARKSIDFYYCHLGSVSETARNKLFSMDLVSQLHGSIHTAKSEKLRFPSEVLADICMLIDYSADSRQMINYMDAVDARRREMNIQRCSSLIDPVLRQFKHEEIVAYLTK